MATQPGGVPKEDRQFSLILALLSTRSGLTKKDIFETVYGYVDTFDPYNEKDLERVNRMFERDKEEILALGAPLQRTEVFDFDDNQDFRYTINADAFELPADITFTPTEVALLQLASHIWREGSLSLDSRHAMTKIAALGIPTDNTFLRVVPRLSPLSATFQALEEAQRMHAVVDFLYQKPGQDAPELRTATPLGLGLWRGQWYMLALDIAADAERTFLLSRIVQTPRRKPNVFTEVAAGDYAQRLIDELEARAAQHQATVWAASGSKAHMMLEYLFGPARDDVFVLSYADEEILSDQLIAMLDSVTVLSPESLRDRVLTKLQQLRAQQEVSA